MKKRLLATLTIFALAIHANCLFAGIFSEGSEKTKTVLYDTDGNAIESHLDVDGGYHLGVAITQSVFADVNNSSTNNLNSGNAYTYTGTGASTLGVVGLQWSLKTDQNAMIYIEQSDTQDANWDISDSYNYYYARGGTGGTVQALKSYWRIRVVLTGTTPTTYFRVAGVLCPIAEPLPRKLSNSGNLQVVSSLRDNEVTTRHAGINPTSELNISPVYRLVGTAFVNSTKDPNFWTETVANRGTVTQLVGQVILETTPSGNSAAKYASAREARFVAGSANKFAGGFNWVTGGIAGNVRRCGAYDATDGYFFQLAGSVFSIGTRTGSADSLVTNGIFNGTLGSDFTPTSNTYYKVDIEYTPLGAFWYINNRLLHSIKQTCCLAGTQTLPVTIENTNKGFVGSVFFHSVGAYIARQGELKTNPAYFHVPSTAGDNTYVLKYGAGVLHSIAINDPAAECILTIYDNTVAATPTIAILRFETKVLSPFIMAYNLPFSTGLTITTDALSDFTIIYE